MQLPEAPGEQAGIWSGGHVSFSSWGEQGFPGASEKWLSSAPMGAPKVNFLLFFIPNGQQLQDHPIPSNALPQREASLPSTPTDHPRSTEMLPPS